MPVNLENLKTEYQKVTLEELTIAISNFCSGYDKEFIEQFNNNLNKLVVEEEQKISKGFFQLTDYEKHYLQIIFLRKANLVVEIKVGKQRQWRITNKTALKLLPNALD